jgi:hypothetical protein
MSSLLREVMLIDMFKHLRLEDYNQQVEAQDHHIDELRLLRTYHNLQDRSHSVDDTCT